MFAVIQTCIHTYIYIYLFIQVGALHNGGTQGIN